MCDVNEMPLEALCMLSFLALAREGLEGKTFTIHEHAME